jgi:hypothetical protein
MSSGNPLTDHSLDSLMDKMIAILVLPRSSAIRQISSSPFASSQKDLFDLHAEVEYCRWSMNVSLSVYMKMLYLVDIGIRQEISGNVSKFLAEWNGTRDHQLSAALDELIIFEFKRHEILEIPDTELIQADKGCQLLNSTIESYIKDIAIKLDSSSGSDLDTTIDVVFPPSNNFIGRYFFPRLATVSYKLLELIKRNYCVSSDFGSDTTH